MTNKVIVKDSFIMPAVGETTELLLRECADLVPYCWIWNKSVGYLEVTKYSGYDIYVTVKNPGLEENAVSGTVFPTCMEFLITSPKATPIIDNTVTCLRADFKSPEVGQEALMSVQSSSAIRVGDIIVVGTRYQYLVTEIINEFTIKVLNEEKGAEGVINIECDECVPVKILESTHCCEALQDQVDDIYNRIDTKKSVVSNNILLSVDHGIDAIPDVSYDIELDIDTDLSKYDNSVSKFTSLRYFKENTAGINASFNPDRSTGYTNYDLGTNINYYDNIYVNEIHGGTGRSSYIKFQPDGSDTEYYNGTSSAYNAHAFFSGGKKLAAFAHDEAYFYTSITPNPGSTLNLGLSGKEWNNIYTDSITLNGTTYTSIPTVNDATLDIQKNGTSVGTFTANASSNSTVNITVPTDTSDLTNGAGYITSASLPTVNDAKLTIYESDGVTPLVEFTANASSAVTATLPAMTTVNDAKLTIYESDGVTPFVEFTANAASNVTATLPAATSSLVYFEESYDSGTDTATFRPKSGTATSFNIGHFFNVYTQNIKYSASTGSYIHIPASNSGSMIINNGTSGTYGTDYNNIIINLGTNTKVTIDDTQITPRVDVIPYADNTYDLGSSSKAFAEGTINTIYTQNISPTTGNTDINISSNISPGTSNTYNIGTSNSNYFSESYIRKMYVGEIHIGTGNTNTVWFYTANDFRFENESSSGTVNVYSGQSGTSNLGTSSYKWNNVWTEKINGSNYNPSDRDKKENIVKRNSNTKGKKTSLEIVNSLDTYTYNYKDDEDKLLHIGIMAQDLESLEPDCVVDKGDDNTKGEHEKDLYIDTFGFITILVEAVQELSAEVKELKSKLGEKDADNKVLEK